MAYLLAIRLASLVGIGVTSYALYVEHKMAAAKKEGDEYEALCDFRGDGFQASCTAVLGSTYGHILSHWGVVKPGSALDFSNATLGLIFYLAALFHDQLAFVIVNPPLVLVAASAGSLAFSGYLAYILNVVLKDFCVVCTSMYVCNTVIFLASLLRWWGLGKEGQQHVKQA